MAARAWLLFALVLSASFAPTAGSTHGGTVRVVGDEGFVAPHWSGSGTADDPYRPTFSTLVASGGYAVELSGTQKHVNLSGLTITGGGGGSDAIRLYDVRNVTVHGSTLESNRLGIHVRGSSDVTLVANTIKTSQVGVLLESARGVTLRDNRLSLNDKDVQLRQSTGNTLTNNNLSVATGQFGLHFDDNASYDNRIDASNVVNAIPVRWYTGLAGTAAQPIVISGVVVDLPRMTNVAQIMLHNSSHVRIVDAVAKAGAAAGIHVHRSSHVELVRSTTDGNGGSGVFLELSDDSAVSNASSRNNTQHGLLLQSTRNTLVESSTVTGNKGQGIRVAASAQDTTLSQLAIAANAGGGAAAENARGVTIGSSSFTSNGGAEVSLVSSQEVLVASNTFGGAGATGIALTRGSAQVRENAIAGHAAGVSFVAATGSNFTDNLITLPKGGIGFAFDGPQSYDNAIAPSNLVNGTAMRWYTNVVGPLVLDGLRVEQSGMTNVAQIMLLKTRNVTLTDAVARNGSAAGIVAYIANDTGIANATVADNAAQGLLSVGSLRLDVSASIVTRSGAEGAKLLSSPEAMLENNVIEGGKARGVLVETSSAPTLRGNAILRNVGIGLHLDRVGPGGAAADHNLLERNLGGGIVAGSSTVGTLFNNTLQANGPEGIYLSSAPPGARIENNTLVDHARAVRLAKAGGAELLANTIVLNGSQTGFHFDDEASYDVTLPTSNTVNGTAVRWYAGLDGVTVESPVVEQRGITNVAQVMLYRVSNLTLSGARAANGTDRGIFALRSDNVTLLDAQVEGNTRAGIHVESTKQATISGAASQRNGQEGLLARLSGGLLVANASFRQNDAAGVSLQSASSPAARLENLTVNANVVGVALATSSGARLHNSSIWANGARGLSVESSDFVDVSNNTVEDHARAVHLLKSTRGAFTHNVVTLVGDQTAWHFEDTASYNTSVGETNLVNGVPMRWYANARDLVLDGARAELRGMTNVAQVMLYESHGARLADVRASNGSARGLFVLGSDAVRVDGGELRNNSADGLQVERSGGLVVDGTVARDNRGDGMDLLSGGVVTIEDATMVNNSGAGLRVGPLHASASGSWLQRNGQGGIVLSGVAGGTFVDNDLLDEPVVGIAVRNTTSAPRLLGNRIANATQGISFHGSEFTNASDNVISISSGQTGFHFADERSYNNPVGTSNTVNGAPVHWYTTLAGTETNPVTLEGVRSEVRGITNVAQVMLYRSAYVHLGDVVATNGTARGVYLYRSSSIALDGANASDNALHGVELRSTQSATVTDLVAQRSGSGVHVSDSPNNVLARVDASGTAAGVVIADAASRDNRVEGVTTTGKIRGVTDAGWNGQGLPGSNVIVDAGAPKRAKIGGTVDFADTTVTYRLEASRIVSQTMTFGDGSDGVTSTGSGLLRPSHAYASAGTYVANLTATTADGLTLSDSVTVEIVPPLTAPRDLLAVPGGRSVTLSWSAPLHDGAADIVSYRIHRGVNSSVVPFVGEVPGSSRSFLDANLENGRAYTYRVTAVTADGEGPAATTMATPLSSPSAPQALTAAPIPNGSILTWSAPADTGGLPVWRYEILRATNGTALGVVESLGNVTEHTVRGLTNGVTYTFAVRATNAVGSGLLSGNATVTPIGPAGPPLAPRALPGDASATLIWSPPSDTGGTPVTGYRVWRGSSDDSLVALPEVVPPGTTRYRDSGLSNGARYVYAVSAVNAHSDGARSERVVAVPQAIDSLRPVVFDREPAGGAVLGEGPRVIRAQYVDNDGVVLDSVRVYVEGSQVGAKLDETGFTYELPSPLGPGVHTVRVVARDPSGNEADETWSFRVLSEEERVPRFELTGHALVPAHAAPGANVTARVSLGNVGHAAGDLTVSLLLGENALAHAQTTLAAGEAQDLFLEFEAPLVLGVYNLTLAGAPLVLTVGDAPLGEAPSVPEPLVDEPEEAPRRPERNANVSAREPPRAETPWPGVALVVLVLALAAVRRRKE